MREHLYRGFNIASGKWIEGDLRTFRDGCTEIVRTQIEWADGIKDAVMFPVIPETVGEFTGLLDRNGVKIFEGDIVKLINGSLFEICYGVFLPNPIKEYCKRISRKANKIIGFYGKHLAGGVEGAEGEEVVLTDYSAAYGVTGNIHDNTEPLNDE